MKDLFISNYNSQHIIYNLNHLQRYGGCHIGQIQWIKTFFASIFLDFGFNPRLKLHFLPGESDNHDPLFSILLVTSDMWKKMSCGSSSSSSPFQVINPYPLLFQFFTVPEYFGFKISCDFLSLWLWYFLRLSFFLIRSHYWKKHWHIRYAELNLIIDFSFIDGHYILFRKLKRYYSAHATIFSKLYLFALRKEW